MALHHADAVAKDGAAGQRAAGVDRDDTNPPPLLAYQVDQRGNQCAFPGARRPRDADYVGRSGSAIDEIENAQGGWVLIFDERGEAGQDATVFATQSFEHVEVSYHNGDGSGALSRR